MNVILMINKISNRYVCAMALRRAIGVKRACVLGGYDVYY